MKFCNRKKCKRRQTKQPKQSYLKLITLKIMRIKLMEDLNNINLRIGHFMVLQCITVVVDETMKEMVN